MTIALNSTDCSGFLENPSYFWIHLYIKVAFLSSLFMPSLNSRIDPIIKWLANQGVNDIGYILAWQLLKLDFNHWQSSHNIIILHGEIH